MSTYILAILLEAEPSALLLSAGLLSGAALLGLLAATTFLLRRRA